MKTIKYISAILLLLIISCTSENEFDLVKIPTIEPKFGVNTYATIDDYKTVEGIELEVDTTKDLRLTHGNPENITDEVDGLITWQYLSDGIGFEVNATTDIIEKVYLYSTLYQDYSNNYTYQIQEDLAGMLLGTMKVIQIVDNVDNTIIPANGIIQEATGGEVNGVYYYDYEGIGRFIYISDSIDNKEGLVVQVVIGAVEEVLPSVDTWLDVDNSITDITFADLTSSTTCPDCSITTVTNPDTADTEATNVTQWTIASTSGKGNKSLNFTFKSGEEVSLADYANLIITVRMYWPSFTDITNYDSNKRFRLYLSDGTSSQQKQVNFIESNEDGWHTVVFDFSTLTPTLTGDVVSGEFRLIGNKFTNIDNGLDFYIDTITTNID
jgi:hypothetical protein